MRHDGLAFGCGSIRFRLVASCAADLEVVIVGWSAVCICLDVVYLGTVGCSPVDVVEGDWAVDALGLSAVLCVS